MTGSAHVSLNGVQVAMRDGTILVSDVHLPSADAADLPTVLVRTTYGRQHVDRSVDVPRFTDEGYAVVVQDVRGRYDSEGSFYHGVAEVEDGYDTLEWIGDQPWSNGRIGMTGVSYLAAVQCAAACSGSDGLAAMFHVKAPFDYFRHGNRQEGAFQMYMLPITLYFASTSPEALRDTTLAQRLGTALADSSRWLTRLPLKPGLNPLSPTPSIERWLIDMMKHELYDEFWKAVPLWQPGEHLDEYADVAGYYVGGWYDMYREDTFYRVLAGRQSNRVKLLMGPWTHFDFGSCAGDVDFGPDAALDHDSYMSLQLRWFAESLKGERESKGDDPPVRIFVMGGGSGLRTAGRMHHGGSWRDEEEWPLARTRYTQFYLHPDGGLSDAAPSEPAPPSRFRYDPTDPVPTVGGTAYFIDGADEDAPPSEQKYHLFVPYGPHDQRDAGSGTGLPLASRHDVLVFQTSVLGSELEVTGPITCEFWFSSTAVDTDLTVKLVDVYPPNRDYPDGYAMNVTDGMLRLRYRKSFERPDLLEPGRVETCRVELAATSNVFGAGHRLRVDVSSSSYPAIDPNPNTGEAFGGASTPVPAVNSIYHDVARASSVTLPVISTSP